MMAPDFFHHAEGIRMAIVTAIDTYCMTNQLPFTLERFEAGSDTDLQDVAKDVLFHGAEVFPDS